MTALKLLDAGLDLFAFAMILILFISNHKDKGMTYDTILFSKVEILFLCCALGEALSWVFDSQPGGFSRFMIYFSNGLFMTCECFAMGYWYRYVHYRLTGKTLSSSRLKYYNVPFYAMAILMALAPVLPLFYTVDASNTYHRTTGNAIMSVFLIILMFYTSHIALVQRRHEQLPDRKNECTTLALFIVPLIIGGILQLMFYGISSIIPLGALSILIVDLNLKNHRIMQDPLTGLNNRGALDRYMLASASDSGKRSDSYGVMMLDIDRFKEINDTYGHAIGDQALIEFSSVLKKTCYADRTFLCRYGGDEFVIIIRNVTIDDLQALQGRIKAALLQHNMDHPADYILKTSIGTAHATNLEHTALNELIVKADQSLYLSKRQS